MDYEAQGLIPLISNSPLLSWMHGVFGTQGTGLADEGPGLPHLRTAATSHVEVRLVVPE
ncbi:DUF417 family protein [Pseudomonas haemolytica]|uniref:DUF417 family protein n=1 Tax=Pseudomonas haemolytica TaxID=2600065 RepID=A0A5P1D782_9PSED|nr:DUF417 family protein [Pseudomonas haemolytica]MBJ2247490.1 DUF417 family protein [Pseudomonas haemolytica]MBJ2272248.1 DUF417 family protein [Pseudomonas haemolytica]MBK3450026.1 DUF417 family protein [Pseudomonas haemolytica]MBK3461610.1 DUF417 family protein [Pseudomonas haemolytica]MRJ36301.1 DUF417 family protein [Pseudomonas haemolytica]